MKITEEIQAEIRSVLDKMVQDATDMDPTGELNVKYHITPNDSYAVVLDFREPTNNLTIMPTE